MTLVAAAITSKKGQVKKANSTSDEVEFEVPYTQTLNTTPEKRLKNALEQVGIYSSARDLFNVWPSVETACVALSNLLTEFFPDNGGYSLLGRSIQLAMCDYKRALICGDEEPKQIQAFLRRLILSSAQCVRWWVIGLRDGNEHAYLRVIDEPVADWMRRHKVTGVRFEPRTGGDIADAYSRAVFLIAGKILTVADARPALCSSLLEDIRSTNPDEVTCAVV